ncbi:MAG: FixH family protein [Saprospiraceae bacterium]|nr:FixH family protein [Saprospiraceae bacterium]
MFKLNWGWGIAIFYSLFVVIMVAAVVKSSIMGVDLVQEQYYDADIAYESFRQSRANAEKLSTPPSIQVYNKSQTINIDFNNNWKQVDGTVKMYRPSDKYADRSYEIDLSKGVMKISTQGLKPGRWKIQLTWKGDGVPFYMENSIMI